MSVASFLRVCWPLSISILIRAVAGLGEARTYKGCKAGLPPCSVAVATLLEEGSALNLLEQKP